MIMSSVRVWRGMDLSNTSKGGNVEKNKQGSLKVFNKNQLYNVRNMVKPHLYYIVCGGKAVDGCVTKVNKNIRQELSFL